MNLSTQLSVPATVAQTWAAFNHMELIASCLPGATLTSVDGHDFSGSLRVKLGPSILTYSGTGTYSERHLGGRHTLVLLNGVEQRGRGSVEARVTSSFTEAGDRTSVRVDVDVTFAGPPTQLADGVVAEAVERLVAQFADAAADRFAAGLGAEALAADANPSSVSDLGTSAGSASKTYTYNPPTPASQTDYDVFAQVAPRVVKRFGPPLVGGLVLLWLVRKLRRR